LSFLKEMADQMEFVKEQKWFLPIFIQKVEYLTIEDCPSFHRAFPDGPIWSERFADSFSLTHNVNLSIFLSREGRVLPTPPQFIDGIFNLLRKASLFFIYRTYKKAFPIVTLL